MAPLTDALRPSLHPSGRAAQVQRHRAAAAARAGGGAEPDQGAALRPTLRAPHPRLLAAARRDARHRRLLPAVWPAGAHAAALAALADACAAAAPLSAIAAPQQSHTRALDRRSPPLPAAASGDTQGVPPRRGGYSWEDTAALNSRIAWPAWSAAVLAQHARGELEAGEADPSIFSVALGEGGSIAPGIGRPAGGPYAAGPAGPEGPADTMGRGPPGAAIGCGGGAAAAGGGGPP